MSINSFEFDLQKSQTIEKSIVVGLKLHKQKQNDFNEHLEELKLLIETAGAQIVDVLTQNAEKPDSKFFIGSGKALELAEMVKDHEADLVVFDDDLSSSQIRNLENLMEAKIMDRSGIILHIFANNAKTSQARTQVELAQNQYILPRLTRMWTHLQKQKGGIGMRGPGEKEIETDRRIINDRISLLKTKLEKIEKQGETQRKSRTDVPRVALVGYTNAGKSTLMNALSKANILAENRLFATLDSTVRKVVFAPTEERPRPFPFLLSDTVGFIRKLPHSLIESFKSTLAEVRDADLLLHVIDLSSSAFEEHIKTVNQTLLEINAQDIPSILVFNKTDAYNPKASADDIFEDETIYDINELKKSWIAKEFTPVVFISAKNKEGLEELKELILMELSHWQF